MTTLAEIKTMAAIDKAAGDAESTYWGMEEHYGSNHPYVKAYAKEAGIKA